jgi:hypothetical protein
MANPWKRRLGAIAFAGAAALVIASPAHAAPEPDVVFDAGMACPGFKLGVTITSNPHRVTRTFEDAAGNTVRIIDAGKGSDLVFVNQTTGTTVTTMANGAVSQTLFNSDGTQTVTIEGHNVLILFPSDVPAGPTTSLYTGRVVYTMDASGITTLVSTSGTARDICAELAP